MELEAIKSIIEFGIVGACFIVFLLLYIKGTGKHMDDLKTAASNEKDAWKTVLPVAEEASSVMKGFLTHLENQKDRDHKLMAMVSDIKSGQQREEQMRSEDRQWFERQLDQIRKSNDEKITELRRLIEGGR